MGTGNDNDRYVIETATGWGVVKEEQERASALYPTQAEAIDRAREIVRNLGGGEVVVRGRNGEVREKFTVAPGNDPRSSAG